MTERTVGELGEAGVIALFSPPGGPVGAELILPNGDDAAAYRVEPGLASVVTTDTLIEGIHFVLDHAPVEHVGRKLMAVNLSDLASMGAAPRYALLSVSMPKTTPASVAERIAHGIRELAMAHRVAVIGGNVTGSPGPIILTATLIGEARPEELVRRDTAQVGNAIFVTGFIGAAKAGLQVALSGERPLPPDPRAELVQEFTDPIPRVAAGRALAASGFVTAMCDVSDGLAADLAHLMRPAGLGAVIEAAALPVSAALRGWCDGEGRSVVDVALEGGEDYELLLTAPAERADAVVRACALAAVPVARVGTVVDTPRIRVRHPDGRETPPPGGFEHF